LDLILVSSQTGAGLDLGVKITIRVSPSESTQLRTLNDGYPPPQKKGCFGGDGFRLGRSAKP